MTRPQVAVEVWHGEAAVKLTAGETTATFLPNLGMLGVSLQYAGRELLALPGGVRAYRHQHMTGLPLLAPWANRLAGRRYRAMGVDVDLVDVPLHTDGSGLPIHGTMAAQPGWQITALEHDDRSAALRARFDFGTRADLLRSFPFPHVVDVTATVDDGRLELATAVTATGDLGVPISFGYHPYFSLHGTARNRWRLRVPDRAHLLLDDRGIPTGERRDEGAEVRPLGRRTFDDLFALSGDRVTALLAEDMSITLSSDDCYPYMQLFAPPRRRFLCIEPMTAPTNALVTGQHPSIDPGDTFTAAFTVHATMRTAHD